MSTTEEAPTIDSRAGFVAAVHWGVQAAIAEGTRRIVCADPDFAVWPLDEPPLIESFTAWLRLPQRRLVLLAADYQHVPRRSPRFTAWRRDWVHAIEAWQPPEELRAGLPSVLCGDGATCVHLIDTLHWRGRAASDPRSAQQWRDRLDAFLQRSEPAFPAQTLGL